MRADRLVALLLLLQSRGRLTAAEAAGELEISERTARRDLEALGMAGLPVFSRQGRNGGWELLGGGRTDLSGLTAAETRALFLVAGPASAATPQVKAALRKLIRALPESFRSSAEAASSAIIVDPTGWDPRSSGSPQTPPHLEAVQQAVVEGLQVTLGYVARDGAVTTRTADPLGLAAKGRHWYLVAGTEAGLRTFRVDRMTSVETNGEPAERPPGFDLSAAWQLISDEVEQHRTPVHAEALADPDVIPWCRMLLGNRFRIGPPAPDGRVPVHLRGHSIRSLAAEVAGFGVHLEVLGPAELQLCLAEIGGQLTARYGRG